MKNPSIGEWFKLKSSYPEKDLLSIPFVTSIGWLNRTLKQGGAMERHGKGSGPRAHFSGETAFGDQSILLLRTSML